MRSLFGSGYRGVVLVAGWLLVVACGGEVITQSSGGDGGAGATSNTATVGSGGASNGTGTGTTGTTGPGSVTSGTSVATTATTGGGGATMVTECDQACTVLYDCGLQNNNCPGFSMIPEPQFVGPCIQNCQDLPAIIALVNPNDCAGTIQTFKGVSADFAMLCDGGP